MTDADRILELDDLADVVDAHEDTAMALMQAVHDGRPDLVAAVLTAADRIDVVAVILAALLPHQQPRTTTAGHLIECGTNEGYALHIREGEPTCLACRAAHATANAAYRESRRAQLLAEARSATSARIARTRVRTVQPGFTPLTRTA